MAHFKGSTINVNVNLKRNPFVFGEIPGFPVGSEWPGRRELCDDGVHPYLVKGIHGRGLEGAFSIVLSGIYDDDQDFGDDILYTGEGGRDKDEWGNAQIVDQKWVRGNKALKTSSENKFPVRVIRGHTLSSHFAPKSGYRYDGLYTVQEAEYVKGVDGYLVCRFRLKRNPNQPPIPIYGCQPSTPVLLQSGHDNSSETPSLDASPNPTSSIEATQQHLANPPISDVEVKSSQTL